MRQKPANTRPASEIQSGCRNGEPFYLVSLSGGTQFVLSRLRAVVSSAHPDQSWMPPQLRNSLHSCTRDTRFLCILCSVMVCATAMMYVTSSRLCVSALRSQSESESETHVACWYMRWHEQKLCRYVYCLVLPAVLQPLPVLVRYHRNLRLASGPVGMALGISRLWEG